MSIEELGPYLSENGENIREQTHNGADPYYGYTKMLWMKNHEPENWACTKLFLPHNDYVIYKMAGEVAIDYSSAGNIGGIFDMNTRTWSEELLDAMGIPKSMMPQRIVESTDIVGGLTKEIAEELGLCEGMPVIASGIDCGAANIGLGVFESGVYAAAIGTSMCAALISDKPVKGKGLIIWPYLYDAPKLSYYFAGGNTAGAIVKWFRNTLCQWEIENQKNGGPSVYDVLNGEAEKIPAGIGTGILTYEEVKKWQVLDKKIMPNEENHKKYNKYFRLYKNIYNHLKEDMKDLTKVEEK